MQLGIRSWQDGLSHNRAAVVVVFVGTEVNSCSLGGLAGCPGGAGGGGGGGVGGGGGGRGGDNSSVNRCNRSKDAEYLSPYSVCGACRRLKSICREGLPMGWTRLIRLRLDAALRPGVLLIRKPSLTANNMIACQLDVDLISPITSYSC